MMCIGNVEKKGGLGQMIVPAALIFIDKYPQEA